MFLRKLNFESTEINNLPYTFLYIFDKLPYTFKTSISSYLFLYNFRLSVLSYYDQSTVSPLYISFYSYNLAEGG